MFPRSAKFLVVDDFATMRKIVEKMLAEFGYANVEEASDGASALNLLQKAAETDHPFDMVICDWNMPGLSGLEVLRKCRNDAKLKQLPFIMVTCESEQSNILEAANLGVSDYAVKPFSSKVFQTKLEKVWKKHHGKSAAIAETPKKKIG